MHRRSIAHEEELLHSNVLSAVADARQFMKKAIGKAELRNRVEGSLAKEERDRKMKELTWTGVGKKPTMMSEWEKIR